MRRFNEDITIQAQILVGADGLQSQVGKWAGLHTHIKLNELASCLQFITDRVETNGLLEIITGDQWAPGGYAWIFPKGHGYAEIGIGVIRSSTGRNPQWYLDQLIHNSFLKERFKHVRILEIQGGGVPLAAPLVKQYADNLILVGDAARHVNPITGGGIHTALSGGKIAAEFISGIIKNNIRPSNENLKGYHDRWLEELGDKMWKLYEIKNTIFKTKDIQLRDELLFNTMSEYFSPDSEYKKI
jgi:digeranylgeranylglycerophospholipid reductase